jgi:hypothetical protein
MCTVCIHTYTHVCMHMYIHNTTYNMTYMYIHHTVHTVPVPVHAVQYPICRFCYLIWSKTSSSPYVLLVECIVLYCIVLYCIGCYPYCTRYCNTSFAFNQKAQNSEWTNTRLFFLNFFKISTGITCTNSRFFINKKMISLAARQNIALLLELQIM